MTPSPYQQAIFAAIRQGSNSLIISAVAGSGKTTTITEAAGMLDPLQSILYLAFNKRIVLELQRRLPEYVDVRTVNSLGHRTLLNYSRTPIWKLEDRKPFRLLDDVLGQRHPDAREGLAKLHNLARAHGVRPGTNDDSVWDDLIEMYEIDFGHNLSIDQIIDVSDRLLSRGIEWARRDHYIDYNDQLYLPVVWRLPFDRYDWVFVDEAQDLSPIQHEMLAQVLEPKSRLVAVGDRYQSIYAFRGADTNSMDNLKQAFGCVELPLSISYRCAKAIVKAAQQFVPDIQPFDQAPEGVTRWVDHLPIAELRPTDAVLCRFTAPLIATAYQLIGEGVPCKVLGRDIGKKLGVLVKRMKAESLEQLIERLGEYRRSETQRLIEKHLDAKLANLDDQLQALAILIDKSKTVDDLLQRIDVLFSDDLKQVLMLMTVHKAKGLEFPRVFILDKKIRRGNPDQERNIKYVAATRAKTELVYVTDRESID
jgi:DNA helicase-2/ATP-dependent DNA helicase PcrA